MEDHGWSDRVREFFLRFPPLGHVTRSFKKRSGINLEVDVCDLPRLTQDKETALFRVVQECLTNTSQPLQLTEEIACSDKPVAARGSRRVSTNIPGPLDLRSYVR